MTRMARNFASAAVALICTASAASALSADGDMKAFLEARHDHYHALGDAFKTIRDASRESQPDWAAIRRAAQKVDAAAAEQDKWFPKGSGPEAGKTRALPVIWAKPQEFSAAKQKFSNAAPALLAAATAGDAGAVRAQFAEVGKACKNCHDTFRSPDEHD